MSTFSRTVIRQWLLLLVGAPLFFSSSTLSATLVNREAVIPPQCYTKTEGRYNPCYVCHQTHPKGSRINVMKDGDIQGEYSFSDVGETNQWRNLFTPRAEAIQSVTDGDILEYVRQDNYSPLLSLQSSGYVPDLENYATPELAFDDQGVARDGSGWVAFNYKPLPSTFWPTNGSFDDVVIRLPDGFQKAVSGEVSRAIYLLNLSLVEMTIKDLDRISIPAVDEAVLEIDLNRDGALGTVTELNRRDHYLGAAHEVEVIRQQYPAGTEFLHSVRYLDITSEGKVAPSPRFKELRYSRKVKTHTEASLAFLYNQEHREKQEERLPRYSWAKPAGEAGLNNKMGWTVQGWIEDDRGVLRRQSYEENFFCMGCHTSIGTTIDQTFAFPRKITGAAGWGYIDLIGMVDAPNRGEVQGEILTYFQRVGGADEFRQNDEVIERWFSQTGTPDKAAIQQADVYQLITPTPERALALNKAYQQIVLEQSFYLGRDAVLGNPVNVYDQVDQAAVPVLPGTRQFHYDIRLDWPTGPGSSDTEPEDAQHTPSPDTTHDNVSIDTDSDTASGGSLNWLFSVILLMIWRLTPWVSGRLSACRSATTLLNRKT